MSTGSDGEADVTRVLSEADLEELSARSGVKPACAELSAGASPSTQPPEADTQVMSEEQVRALAAAGHEEARRERAAQEKAEAAQRVRRHMRETASTRSLRPNPSSAPPDGAAAEAAPGEEGGSAPSVHDTETSRPRRASARAREHATTQIPSGPPVPAHGEPRVLELKRALRTIETLLEAGETEAALKVAREAQEI